VSTGQSGGVVLGTWAPTTDLNGNVIGIVDRHVTVPVAKRCSSRLSMRKGQPPRATERGGGSSAFANYLVNHAVNLLRSTTAMENVGLRASSPLRFSAAGEQFLRLPQAQPARRCRMVTLSCWPPQQSQRDPLRGRVRVHVAQDGFDFSFTLDITYHLTVSP
jgi:hypothetical protein